MKIVSYIYIYITFGTTWHDTKICLIKLHTNSVDNVSDIFAVLMNLVQILVESDVFLLIDHEHQFYVS